MLPATPSGINGPPRSIKPSSMPSTNTSTTEPVTIISPVHLQQSAPSSLSFPTTSLLGGNWRLLAYAFDTPDSVAYQATILPTLDNAAYATMAPRMGTTCSNAPTYRQTSPPVSNNYRPISSMSLNANLATSTFSMPSTLYNGPTSPSLSLLGS